MGEPGSEFEETGDDNGPGPLLPPEDRLWRHPSEIGFLGAQAADATRAARERWLSTTPSRAGAWSAGLVGAVLATGVVLMGSHITTWLSAPGSHASLASNNPSATTLRTGQGDSTGFVAGIETAVAASMAIVRTTNGDDRRSVGDGVVLRSSGMILVPAALVAGAEAIEVQTPDREVFAGRLVGTDLETGVAVVSIDPDGLQLEALHYAPSYALATGDWTAIEWAQPSTRSRILVDGVRSVTPVSAAPGMPRLEDALDTADLPKHSQLEGAVIVDSAGALIGFVNGQRGGRLVEVPGSLAEQVASEIIHHGHVLHGTLGVVGVSTSHAVTNPPAPSKTPIETTLTSVAAESSSGKGVKLVTVTPRSAGWTAGLRKGDVIEAVNGRIVRSASDLQQDLYVIEPDKPLHLTVARGTRVFTCDTELRAA